MDETDQKSVRKYLHVDRPRRRFSIMSTQQIISALQVWISKREYYKSISNRIEQRIIEIEKILRGKLSKRHNRHEEFLALRKQEEMTVRYPSRGSECFDSSDDDEPASHTTIEIVDTMKTNELDKAAGTSTNCSGAEAFIDDPQVRMRIWSNEKKPRPKKFTFSTYFADNDF